MYPALRGALNEAINGYLQKDDRFVITTRIDNDDAFHRNMISEIRNLFNEQKDIFINFNNGLQYDVEKGILVKMKYINNHFISRIEERNSLIETVITCNHALINEVGEVLCVENREPLWIEIIHSGNISNTLRHSVTMFSSEILNSFGFSAGLSFKNSLKFFVQYLIRITLHGLIVFSKKTRMHKRLKRFKSYLTK